MKVTRKSKLQQIISATQKQANRAVTAAVNEAKSVADFLVPVDTGVLKSRNQIEDDGNGHAKFENDCEYAALLEFGSNRAPAQPFFRPGLDSGRRAMKAEMKIVDK